MKRYNNLFDNKKKLAISKVKCSLSCKNTNGPKKEFWEYDDLVAKLNEINQEPIKSFCVKQDGFFGWIKSIFKR
jgi:hypothetical protein